MYFDSSIPGSALRMHDVELLQKSRNSTSILKALPGKLDITRHSSSFLYLSLFCTCLSLHKLLLTFKLTLVILYDDCNYIVMYIHLLFSSSKFLITITHLSNNVLRQ